MRKRAGLLLGVSAIAATAIAAMPLWRHARNATAAPAHPPAVEVGADALLWPGDAAWLTPPEPHFAKGRRPVRVMIDPGHGAPGNRGNSSCFCVDEQDTMLDLAHAVADRLEATGHIKVWLTRDGERRVEYAERIEEAAAWGAEAFVSLHSDVRGHPERWSPAPGRTCTTASDAPGFAVLYSDEGGGPLVSARLALGRAAARHMGEAGFLPYGGAGYLSHYAPDAEVPGVFVDRHAPDQRIYVLRRAPMPSILVETHNALDPREAARWTQPETIDAFAAAIAAAVADVL
jgi:N-acetylmuramoyl-L-alanine amidase